MRFPGAVPCSISLRSIPVTGCCLLCLFLSSSCDRIVDSNYPIAAHEYVVITTTNNPYHRLAVEISDYYQAPILHHDRYSQSNLIGKLRTVDPLYALVVLHPQHITGGTVSTLFDAFCAIHTEPEDPYLDVAFGYISGLDLDDARALFQRSHTPTDTMHRYLGLSHVYEQDIYCHQKVREWGSYYSHGGWDTTSVISGGSWWDANRTAELSKFSGNQLIFCCGHGSYFSLCGIRKEHFPQMNLTHSIVLSGACYTGGIYPISRSASIPMLMIEHGVSIYIANVSLNGWIYMEHVAEGIFYYDQPVGISFRDGLNIVQATYDRDSIDTLPYVILYGDPSYRPVVLRWR